MDLLFKAESMITNSGIISLNITLFLSVSELHFLLSLKNVKQMCLKALGSLDENMMKTYCYHVVLCGRRVTE